MSLEAARRVVGLRRGDVALWPGRLVGFGDRQIATDSAGNVTINHYGGRYTIPTVSLIDVLDGRVPPEIFKGRAVVVGATAESLSDLFATPYSADIPGAEIMATLTANLVADELIERDIWLQALSAALALLFVSLAFYAASRLSLAAAFAAVPLVWMAAAATVQIAFSGARYGLDATMILAALLFATVWTTAQRFRAQKRVSAELTQERENLSHYVSPFLAEQLASREVPDFDRRAQDAAVLFVDVAGYTALVEMQAPDNTAVFLGELHRLFERCATAHRGVISTFAGDGAMVIFGLPEPGPGDAAAGLACGSMLLEEAGRFTSAVFPDLGLRLRVSMHFGPVTAAVVGGDRQAQVTVTGDIVNVASRLQEIAKEHGTAFVTSRAGLDAARLAGSTIVASFAPLVNQPVRGRSGHIEVWALAPAPD
jgi:adenylate cyclase